MTLALLDADLFAYRCAASAENDDEGIALWRVNDLVNRILHETNSTNYLGFLSGSNNFRYALYPEYKANRKDKPRPRHLEACKELLITEWKCKVTDGVEADDALGIEHQYEYAWNETPILVSIDKDLLQLPGEHYNFVKKEFKTISPLQGLRNFYTQLIEGDASDNIPAFDGKFRTSRPKFVQKLIDPLYTLDNEVDMYSYVCDVYEQANVFNGEYQMLHAQLLYIQKKENDKWETPSIMTAHGQPDDLGASSPVCSEVAHEDGLLNTPV